MKTAVVFPGQGSQGVGMGKEFYDSNETFRAVFDACDAQTDIDLKKACFKGEGLETTSVTQPALYAVNIATYRMLHGMGVQGGIFAGLSLGEYDALAAAGVLDDAETTALVTARGALMETAVPQGVASMSAVIGLSAEDIEWAIKGVKDVWVANINSPTQMIIGGTLEALDVADVKVKDAGAAMVKRLNVAGPFHTPLLREAGEKLLAELEKHEIRPTGKTVYANVTGAPYGAGGSVRDILARQVSSKVYWAKIMNNVIKAADAIIECGPGNVLSKLAKKQAKALGKDIPIFKASTMKDIAEIEKSVRV